MALAADEGLGQCAFTKMKVRQPHHARIVKVLANGDVPAPLRAPAIDSTPLAPSPWQRGSIARVSGRTMDLKEQNLLGTDAQSNWYYLSKGRALRALLGKANIPEVLDVGAGSGVFARQLLRANVCRRAVCVDPNYAEERIERVEGKEIEFRRSVDNVTQRLILMIDVLEHVDDDGALLRNYVDRAPSGAYVLVSVPAFQYLWSGHDDFLEHRRRYTRAQVEALLRRAGLKVVRSRYFFALLFPLIVLLRLHDRRRLRGGEVAPKSALTRQPPLVNTMLTALHALERVSLFRFNRLAGLSVFCLARRP